MRTVCVLALVCACATSDRGPEADELEATLRAGFFPSPANYPGNGDIAVYEGASTASEECLIYTTVGTEVHQGPATGPVIAQVVGNTILDANGVTLCTRDGNELVERVRIGAQETDEVLFTVIGRWVFEGDVVFANKTIVQILADLDAQLLYTFNGPHIYDHSPWDGPVLATATSPLTNASKTRKLVLSSMIAAECGGLGLWVDEDGDHTP
ncbi:MAG: hypothetical protein IPH07_05100 [Deltaproteobacteria bacterium]|nr:hypothetical protein [Deltaproteobacteria bacterium]MBK8237627.1 hypothetical protein [Deltaproteobacteria bacterium]MBK8719499.1 hypothetical protein [Deltaproteobacteria bacterium]MBP7287542.1 hypothetical protein [Nannocystaceae bacterium]